MSCDEFAEHLTSRRFDGIICFGGEDWWYHNRGHYDLQMMRQFSRWVPILYVNSIGMRTPSPREGQMFVSRIQRKVRSVRRGLKRVTRSFAVFSPIVLPSKAGLALTKPWLVRTVRAAARRLELARPLIWVACPTAAEAVEALDPVGLVYQRSDRYECFNGVDADRIRNCDAWLKARADLTVFCATHLLEQEAEDCRSASYVDHGVDFERFASAADDGSTEPEDVNMLRRPRIGFIGGIDAHTFDADLFNDVARQLPEACFVLVGACSLPSGWCERPNVVMLGQRPYREIPAYMASCDILIMPWTRSPWITACNPVKLKEYLAVGRPIVSTPFAELRRYEGLVRTAETADAFAREICRALRDPGDVQARRDRVRCDSWSSRAQMVLGRLGAQGIHPQSQTGGDAFEAISPRAAGVIKPTTSRPSPGPVTNGLRGQVALGRNGVIAKALSSMGQTTSREPAGRGQQHFRRPQVEGAESKQVSLAASIILVGGLRPSPLVAATGRSTLDLWLTADRTVLDCWVQRIAELRDTMPSAMPIRVVHDSSLPPPWPSEMSRAHVIVEREPKAYRGPAGIIRDLCAGYAPDQHVLVIEAARYSSVPLAPLLIEHAARASDITIGANSDGSPAGMYVARCSAVQRIPAVGFVDLKEQWLRTAVDSGLKVHVHQLGGAGALPLRTRRQFLAAARVANAAAPAEAAIGDLSGGLLVAGETSELRVLCPGSCLGPGTMVVESIVMPGATTLPNTVVARSLLCPHARSRATVIVDAVVRSSGSSYSTREGESWS